MQHRLTWFSRLSLLPLGLCRIDMSSPLSSCVVTLIGWGSKRLYFRYHLLLMTFPHTLTVLFKKFFFPFFQEILTGLKTFIQRKQTDLVIFLSILYRISLSRLHCYLVKNISSMKSFRRFFVGMSIFMLGYQISVLRVIIGEILGNNDANIVVNSAFVKITFYKGFKSSL